ncbi:MAG: LD-carboxypeptidase, partial [Nitrospira sp.]|nr:LD-carboxypeptidase [Nitrospira sp.]
GAIVPHELESGVKRLEGLGFRVKLGKSIRSIFRTMAGTDRERADDLLQMFSDPQVKAVVCARGGYGSARVIPHLDRDLIRKCPKVFVGSSDITALLLYLVQDCGLVAFHGPMVGPNFGKAPSPLTEEVFLRVLTQNQPAGPLRLPNIKVLKTGRSEGRLVGGCLSLLCSVMGTPFDAQTDDAILFLEDVKEPPYRIDRMLTQLKAAGKFRKVRGVLFGPMLDCQPQQGAGYNLEEIILDVLNDLQVPILFGVPSGHGEHNVTLPMGVRVRVSALTESPCGVDGESVLSIEEAAVSLIPGGDAPGGVF